MVAWPAGIAARGEIRPQYAHVIDMVPTVLAALGVEPPETIRGVTQSPIEGVSFAHTFDDADAPSRHHTQYFEMLGHRAIDHDGWRAVCPGRALVRRGGRADGAVRRPHLPGRARQLDATGWELYHIAEDPAENRNVAAENP